MLKSNSIHFNCQQFYSLFSQEELPHEMNLVTENQIKTPKRL